MKDNEIREILDISLDGASALRDTAAQQYMVYLRRYITVIGPLEKATHAKLVAFIEELDSPWSRRRAVSAFRRFFQRALLSHSLKTDPTIKLVDCGFARPKEYDLATLRNRLKDFGMPPAKIAALTWRDVKLLVLESGQSDMSRFVGSKERSQFRALLLRRFPTASRLASTSKNKERCFARLLRRG